MGISRRSLDELGVIVVKQAVIKPISLTQITAYILIQYMDIMVQARQGKSDVRENYHMDKENQR